MELVFVTNNPGKFKEIDNLLGDKFRLKSLKELNFNENIPETCPTIEENATAKAFYIYNRLSVDCFADDTGLEVEALNNEPGVFSARYAELDGSKKFASRQEVTKANIEKLLKMLEGKYSRKARFKTVISLVLDGEESLFEGVVDGEIINEVRGNEGFGYDPVFVPLGYSRTFAEMRLTEKNKISHRAIAFRKLVEHLNQLHV